MGTTADKLARVKKSKEDIKAALIAQGASPSDVLSTYADEINGLDVVEFEDVSKTVFTTENIALIRKMALDTSGNVYYGSDYGAYKVTSSGTLAWCFTGQAGGVWGIAVDKDGNVYSGGENDRTLRKISPSGTEIWSFTSFDVIGYQFVGLTVFAVETDKDGNVYVGATDGMVRKISSAGAQIWKFSGHKDRVMALCVDKNGNVYSCDMDDNTLRKISPSGAQIWTDNWGDDYCLDLALDETGKLYVAFKSGSIRKINADWDRTGTMEIIGWVAWETDLVDSRITAIGVDSFHNVYFVDEKYRFGRVDSSGRRVWTHSLPYEGSDIVVDELGNIFYGRYKLSNSPVAKLYRNPFGGEKVPPLDIDSMVDSGDPPIKKLVVSLTKPEMFTVDTLGNIFAVDPPGTVKKLTPSGETVWSHTVYNSHPGVPFVSAMYVSPSGYLYCANQTKDLSRFDPRTGSEDIILRLSARQTTSIASYNDEFLYWVEGGQDSGLIKYALPAGKIVWSLKPGGNVVAVDTSDNAYVGGKDPTVCKISSLGEEIWESTWPYGEIMDITVNESGTVYAVSCDKAIGKTTENGQINTLSYPSGITSMPLEIVVDANDDLYIRCVDKTVHKTDANGKQIWKFDGPADFAVTCIDRAFNVYIGQSKGIYKLKQVYKIC